MNEHNKKNRETKKNAMQQQIFTLTIQVKYEGIKWNETRTHQALS